MNEDRPERIAPVAGLRVVDRISALMEYRGLDLTWHSMSISHSTCVFTASDHSAIVGLVEFGTVFYVSVAPLMTSVRFRMGSEGENDSIRHTVDPACRSDHWRGHGVWPEEGHLVIDCDQGRFSVFAQILKVCDLADKSAAEIEQVMASYLPSTLWHSGLNLDEV